MTKKTKTKKRYLGLLIIVPIVLLIVSFRGCPLPEPPKLDSALPQATPPKDMALYQLPTGITHRNAAIAYRGGSFGDKRDFSMTAVLVEHPLGDILIDTGFGRDIDAHIGLMPLPFRMLTSYEHTQSAAEQLDAKGYDKKRLHAILLTHAHWDHVSGIPEFGDTPVWVTPEEHRFIRDGGALTAVARSFTNAHYEEYGFEGGAYLGFAKSHDVYGDGSIVVVPSPGHTPGSVVVFVALPNGKRYAFVGDMVWQREGISLREERPWITRVFADGDPSGVRMGISRMNAIETAFPDLAIVPAHDARSFAPLPRL